MTAATGAGVAVKAQPATADEETSCPVSREQSCHTRACPVAADPAAADASAARGGAAGTEKSKPANSENGSAAKSRRCEASCSSPPFPALPAAPVAAEGVPPMTVPAPIASEASDAPLASCLTARVEVPTAAATSPPQPNKSSPKRSSQPAGGGGDAGGIGSAGAVGAWRAPGAGVGAGREGRGITGADWPIGLSSEVAAGAGTSGKSRSSKLPPVASAGFAGGSAVVFALAGAAMATPAATVVPAGSKRPSPSEEKSAFSLPSPASPLPAEAGGASVLSEEPSRENTVAEALAADSSCGASCVSSSDNPPQSNPQIKQLLFCDEQLGQKVRLL
mmetsp:Transcript_84516/g.213115  ORF Transcript_84516/g.213115 Transcript_84516/m.213115 type:complete len:334 (-) Transcript_84516:875-1876(-)